MPDETILKYRFGCFKGERDVFVTLVRLGMVCGTSSLCYHFVSQLNVLAAVSSLSLRSIVPYPEFTPRGGVLTEEHLPLCGYSLIEKRRSPKVGASR